MNTLEHNKQLCREYFQAFLARDTAWMAKHIAPDFVRHDPGLPFEVKGPEGVAQLHDALLPAFPDMQLPLLDFVAEGNKVLDLFQFENGVLVEHWALLDNLGMLKQLGALPA